jgi:DNA-binding CsgD family transcriptional regulator
MGRLIGRDGESRVAAAVLDARGTVVLAGPAGIGKSALARHVLEDRPHLHGGGLALLAERRYAALEQAVRQPLEGQPETVAELLLRRLAGRVLLVEDAHWTDAATAEVLCLLLDHAPLLVTTRGHSECWDGGGDTHRHFFEKATIVPVGPLPVRTAGRLARLRHPGLDDEACRALVEAAQGNPLLIETLVSETDLSPTLASAVAARLSGLASADRDALGRVALLGRPASGTVVGLTTGRRLGGLVRWRDGLVEVAHSLIGEAVVGLVDPSERRRLHAQLASMLPDAEAARHELEAGRAAEAHVRARRAVAAAEDGASRAALLLLAAQTAWGDRSYLDRCWLDAADALIEAGRWTEALTACDHVMGHDPVTAAESALHRGRAMWLAGDVKPARMSFEQGMLALGEASTELAARLTLERAYLVVRHETTGRVAAARAAVDVTERAGHLELRAQATLGAALLYDGQPGWEDLLADVSEAAYAAGDVDLSCTAAYHLSSGLGFVGRCEEGTILAERQAERAAAHGLAIWLAHFDATVLINRGLVGGSPEWVRDTARAFLAAHPVFRNRFHAHNALILALCDLGQTDEAWQHAEAASADASSGEAELFGTVASAEVAWLRGDMAEARRLVDKARLRGDTWFGVRVMVEISAAHLAAEWDEAFEAQLPSVVLPQFQPGLHDVSALQAWQAGDADLALAELDRATTAWQSVSMSRFAARSAYTAAILSHRLGRRDASARRGRTVEIARRGRHGAVLDRIGAARVAELTPREESVLLLIAAGRSTSQAATELGISPATVLSHVQAARRKLGTGSRMEAALRVASGT